MDYETYALHAMTSANPHTLQAAAHIAAIALVDWIDEHQYGLIDVNGLRIQHRPDPEPEPAPTGTIENARVEDSVSLFMNGEPVSTQGPTKPAPKKRAPRKAPAKKAAPARSPRTRKAT